MKTLVMIALLCLGAMFAQAQTLMLDENNKIVEVQKVKKDTIKKADPVHSIVKGVTYFQGPKGGVYCWKVSKKTGEKHKSYLPKKK